MPLQILIWICIFYCSIILFCSIYLSSNLCMVSLSHPNHWIAACMVLKMLKKCTQQECNILNAFLLSLDYMYHPSVFPFVFELLKSVRIVTVLCVLLLSEMTTSFISLERNNQPTTHPLTHPQTVSNTQNINYTWILVYSLSHIQLVNLWDPGLWKSVSSLYMIHFHHTALHRIAMHRNSYNR